MLAGAMSLVFSDVAPEQTQVCGRPEAGGCSLALGLSRPAGAGTGEAVMAGKSSSHD